MTYTEIKRALLTLVKNMVNKGTSDVKSKSEGVCGAIQRNGRFTVINCC